MASCRLFVMICESAEEPCSGHGTWTAALLLLATPDTVRCDGSRFCLGKAVEGCHAVIEASGTTFAMDHYVLESEAQQHSVAGRMMHVFSRGEYSTKTR